MSQTSSSQLQSHHPSPGGDGGGLRYYIIAGEASGDLHGSNLIKELHAQDKNAVIRCWGGDKMELAGATLVKHYRDLAFMGFVEVIKHLPVILRNIDFCKKDITAFAPDVVVFIDYPGFNLRIAKWAKQQGYKTAYYISPQIWAWKEGRVEQIKKYVDLMLVILPFEKEFYRKHQFEVHYAGHPLREVVERELNEAPPISLSAQPIIALLPGSRSQEIKLKLPVMLQMVKHFPHYQFAIAMAPSQPEQLYRDIAKGENVLLVKNTYQLLKQAKAALVTSGTATLETALFGVPQVVCYKGNPISYMLAKKLIKVRYISLVNLIMNDTVVTELIQDALNETQLQHELKLILDDENHRSGILKKYRQLWHLLGDRKASASAAQKIIELGG